LIAAWDEIFQYPARIVSIAAGNSAATVLTVILKGSYTGRDGIKPRSERQ
jgi:hypothetical protein